MQVLVEESLAERAQRLSGILHDVFKTLLISHPHTHSPTVVHSPAQLSLQVLVEEGLAERAEHLGRIFRDALKTIPSDRVKEVRGRGMLNALVIQEKGGVSAWEVCLKLRDNGLLTKPTHGDTIRLAPPLVLTDEQCLEAADVIKRTIMSYDA